MLKQAQADINKQIQIRLTECELNHKEARDMLVARQRAEVEQLEMRHRAEPSRFDEELADKIRLIQGCHQIDINPPGTREQPTAAHTPLIYL